MYGFSYLATLIPFPFQAAITILTFKTSIPFSILSSIPEVNTKVGNSSVSFHASFLHFKSWEHLFTCITLKRVSHLPSCRFHFYSSCSFLRNSALPEIFHSCNSSNSPWIQLHLWYSTRVQRR